MSQKERLLQRIAWIENGVLFIGLFTFFDFIGKEYGQWAVAGGVLFFLALMGIQRVLVGRL